MDACRRSGGLEKWTSVLGRLFMGSFVGWIEKLPATMNASQPNALAHPPRYLKLANGLP